MIAALPVAPDGGGGLPTGWLWWVAVGAVVIAGGWFLLGYRRRDTAVAGAAVVAAPPADGLVALPLRQRFKAWFTPGAGRVKGPSLQQRVRMSAVGKKLATQNGNGGGLRLRDRIRGSQLFTRFRSSETAMSWRARREAREVQRKIRDRRS